VLIKFDVFQLVFILGVQKQGNAITAGCMRFEVFTVVNMSMLVFWVVMSCGLKDKYQSSGRVYYLCLQGRML
jgi:hypothetical protein